MRGCTSPAPGLPLPVNQWQVSGPGDGCTAEYACPRTIQSEARFGAAASWPAPLAAGRTSNCSRESLFTCGERSTV